MENCGPARRVIAVVQEAKQLYERLSLLLAEQVLRAYTCCFGSFEAWFGKADLRLSLDDTSCVDEEGCLVEEKWCDNIIK